MSRTLTTTQVVEKGDYLEPGFNPASLTVAQLLGLLSFHDIKYPTPYTKTKLVQVFNDELKPQTPQLRQERLSRQHSRASDAGIVDGRTGKRIRAARSVRLRGTLHRSLLTCRRSKIRHLGRRTQRNLARSRRARTVAKDAARVEWPKKTSTQERTRPMPKKRVRMRCKSIRKSYTLKR